MREIKFRVWDKEEKNMFDESSDISATWILHNKLYEPYDDRFILMQFTGLKDKNGKEIYEGDVVRHADSPHGPLNESYIYSIFWNDSGFALLSPKSEIPTTFILDKKWGALLEIIGNLYENPELLKV